MNTIYLDENKKLVLVLIANNEKASYQVLDILLCFIQAEPKLYKTIRLIVLQLRFSLQLLTLVNWKREADYSATTVRRSTSFVFCQFLTSPNAHILSHHTKIASDVDLHFHFFQVSLIIGPKGGCLKGHVAHQDKKIYSCPILLSKDFQWCNFVYKDLQWLKMSGFKIVEHTAACH